MRLLLVGVFLSADCLLTRWAYSCSILHGHVRVWRPDIDSIFTIIANGQRGTWIYDRMDGTSHRREFKKKLEALIGGMRPRSSESSLSESNNDALAPLGNDPTESRLPSRSTTISQAQPQPVSSPSTSDGKPPSDARSEGSGIESCGTMEGRCEVSGHIFPKP